MPRPPDPHPVVLFDGVCNLCSGAVQFIIARDPAAEFRFASLQSAAGEALLARHGLALPPGDPETLLLLEGGAVYQRSTAALRIAARLRGPWRLAGALLALPAALRDPAYRLVARHRYRWFGRSGSCRLPTAELRSRFVE